MDKKRRAAIVAALGVMVALGATTASAGTRVLMDVKVPFAFKAGGALLPTGDYLVKEDETGGNMLLLESRDGRHAVWVFSSGEEPMRLDPKQTELIFDKYGNDYYLRDVWAEDRGLSVAETPLVARAARAHKAAPERVRVPAAPKKKS